MLLKDCQLKIQRLVATKNTSYSRKESEVKTNFVDQSLMSNNFELFELQLNKPSIKDTSTPVRSLRTGNASNGNSTSRRLSKSDAITTIKVNPKTHGKIKNELPKKGKEDEGSKTAKMQKYTVETLNKSELFNIYRNNLNKSRQKEPKICIVQSISNIPSDSTATDNSRLSCDRNKSSFQIDRANVLVSPKETIENSKELRNNERYTANKKKIFMRSRGPIAHHLRSQQRILRNGKLGFIKTIRSKIYSRNIQIKPSQTTFNHKLSKEKLLHLNHKTSKTISPTKQKLVPEVPLKVPTSLQSKATQTKEVKLEETSTNTSQIETINAETQCTYEVFKIKQLTVPSYHMKNPLCSENGCVLHVYFELDVLIVIQENLVSFWKTSKIINILGQAVNDEMAESQTGWIPLGGSKRLVNGRFTFPFNFVKITFLNFYYYRRRN